MYLEGLGAAAAVIRSAVAAGVPYLGFSAGAMVAAADALAGGWRVAGRAVCDEDWSEGLDEVELRPGLGLVPFTVDVHAAQGGLLGRTASLPRMPGVTPAVGIDEGTCLSVCQDGAGRLSLHVRGGGFVWDFSMAEDDAVLLNRRPPP